MTHTNEQSAIISHVKSEAGNGLTLIDSVAGSGKTSVLIAIAKAIPHTNGLYLAYNSHIAKESRSKFPSTTHCMTTHAMAYHATVKSKDYPVTLGNFGYKSIKEPLSYEAKLAIVDHIRSFCLSSFTDFRDYATDRTLTTLQTTIALRYLDLMQSNKVECTHEFYLKYFHILLANGSLTYPPFDFIMLDEAGDLNEVTLAIFRLLPSPKKIAVGDKHQNIYQFNETINCFTVLADEGTTFHMTQSFRVAHDIAARVEKFCRRYLDPDMHFKGIRLANKTPRTFAYLSRTNGGLIAQMIEFNRQGVRYGLTRKPQEIFKVPLMLCNLKYQGFITDPAYKFLQADVDEYFESPELQTEFKFPIDYIRSIYSEDPVLETAAGLISRFGMATIIKTYEEARLNYREHQLITLSTAHACKGAEFDSVTILSDLNDSIAKLVTRIRSDKSYEITPKDYESLNLYYVACTRSHMELNNAKHL